MKPLQELRQLSSKHPWLAGLIIGGTIVLQAPAALAALTPSLIFNPVNVTQGNTSRLTITINNDALAPVTGLTFTNLNLPGMRLAATPVVSNSCGGTLTAVPLANTLSLSGGDVPALAGGVDGQCQIVVDVIGFAGGNQTVTMAANSITGSGGATNPQAANATLQVAGLNAVGTVITFGPTLIAETQTSTMTVRLNNGNSISLTGADFASLLPAGLQIRGTTFLSNTCGGALIPTGGPPPTGFQLTGGTIPAGGCEFSWAIEGDLPPTQSQGIFNYSFAAGILDTDQFVSNTAGSGNLTIQQGLRVQQRLRRGSANPGTVNEGGTLQVFTGETAQLTMILSNAGGALTNLNLNQALPAGLEIADAVTASTCTGMTVNATAGASNFNFVGGGIGAATATSIPECTVTVNVRAAAAGTYTNNITVNTISNAQTSNNLNSSAISLQVVNITGSGGNGIGVGIGFQGGMNAAFFAANQVSAGNAARMNISINNGTGIPLTGVGFGTAGITLPANLRLAAIPNPTTDCPGGAASVSGTDTILMAGANLDRRQGCTVSVSVVSDDPTTYTASAIAGTFISTENRSNSAASGNLQVLDYINFEQFFDPTSVAASTSGNAARMRLRLSNADLAASAGTRLRFQLAGSLRFAAGALVGNTCGGTVTLPDGGDQFDLTGATIPAATGQGLADDGVCEIEYTVIAAGAPGTITNTIPPASLDNAAGQSNSTPISATLTLVPVNVAINQQVINVTPGDPNLNQPIVTGGEPARLNVTLTNNSGITLTNVGYTNNLATGAIVYSTPAVDPGTCTGATIAANPNTTSYAVSGITLAPNQSCTFNLQITSLVSGNTDNIIAARDVTSTQGGTNANPSAVTLTVLANATVSKTFTPASIAAGGTSRLNLTVLNANVVALTNVELPDVFPTGMAIADTPNVASTCGGTVTAPGGSDRVILRGGTMTPSSICTISVDVTALTAQPYTNTIPPNALVTAQGRTNRRPIEAVLDVTGVSIVRPGMRLVKRITEIDGTAITGLFDFTPATGRDDDNAPNWPGPIDATAGISPYLQGAYQGAQALAQQNNLQVGSEIEYTGYFLSDGTGPANTAQLCDYLPQNTEFVANSLSAALGSGAALTAQYLPAGSAFPAACVGTNNGAGAVVVNLGNVVNATGAGTPNTAYGNFKFKVTVK